jgi:hypothetical protein
MLKGTLSEELLADQQARYTDASVYTFRKGLEDEDQRMGHP